jgi:DNA-binding SARP family transcriptional activator
MGVVQMRYVINRAGKECRGVGPMIDQEQAVLIRVRLLGEFQVERWRGDGTYAVIEKAAWGQTYARALFKRLLTAPARRMSRSDLVDALFPQLELEKAERYLNDAARMLRKIVGYNCLQSYGPHGTGGYMLAGQDVILTDIDACEALMKEAERIGRTSAAAMGLLEQASEYFSRGGMLEGEGSQWCYGVRSEAEHASRMCSIWLAEAYEARGLLWQARTQYRKLLETNPLDEDALCRLMGMLYRHGHSLDALNFYEQAQARFKEEGLALSETIRQLAERLRKQPSSLLYLASPGRTVPLHAGQDIIEEASEEVTDEQRERYSLNPLRRKLLGSIPLVGEVVTHPDILERLARIFSEPASIDEKSLAYLHRRIALYWQDRNTDAAPVLDLLDDVTQHLHKILTLLEWPHLPGTRTQLSVIAGETSLLVGALLFELGAYAQARAYFQRGVIQAAREAEYPDLEAIGWGWISFTWTYTGKLKQALACIQAGRRLVARSARTAISAWLAAIEAEIQARLGNQDACLRALGEAAYIEAVEAVQENPLCSQFNVQKLAGYQGICYRLLYRPQVAATAPLLVKAQSILQQTLARVDPIELRRQALIHTDLASTYAQQKECEQACKHAMHAVLITGQTRSGVAVQRLFSLRRELEPWKDTISVRSFDENLALLTPWKIGTS